MSEIGLALIGVFALLLLAGVPIYLALGVSSLVTIVAFDLAPLQVLAGTVRSSFNSFTLLAIPLFILAGNLLTGSEIAVRLIDLARAVVGRLRGGLAIVSVMVGIFFAGISGSGPADVGAQGSVLIPALVRDRYPRAYASALIAANGAIGIIIPPSIALVIYGVVANVSIGRLFIAGILPGVVIGVSLAAVSVALARRHGWEPLSAGEALDAVGATADRAAPSGNAAAEHVNPGVKSTRSAAEEAAGRVRTIARAFRRAVWGLLAPLIILGGIYGGVFTPTEAAAVVVFYALFVGMAIYRDIKPVGLAGILVESAKTSGVVMIIIASASLFAFLLNSQGIAREFASTLTELAPNAFILLLAINLILLLASCLLDAVSIYYIFVPILLPVALALDVDPVHFGIITTVNLAIGQVTPPVGVNLFVACAVGGVSLAEISKAVVPIVAAQVVALLVITYVPGLSLWLPNLLGA